MRMTKFFAILLSVLFVYFGVCSAAKPLISSMTLGSGDPITYPTIADGGGVYVGGANSLIIYFDWTAWNAGTFAVQPIFAQSKTDTGATYYSCTWADSITCGPPYDTGPNGSLSIRLVDDGIFPAGYLFLRIYKHANTDIDGFTAKVELGY